MEVLNPIIHAIKTLAALPEVCRFLAVSTNMGCETLFNVLLQPYWIILAGFLCTTVLSILIKLIELGIKKKRNRNKA